MTYRETLDYLFTQLPFFQREGASAYKPGLDTIKQLDQQFNHPHLKYPTVHVAGTNGKGSVSHLTASVLQAMGLRVGLFTSPHLKDFRERIRVNGKLIPEPAVVDFVARYQATQNNDLQPSFFELTTLMAFDWFARQAVDVAIIEVGLGGRLDSTNIIRPLCSVITNISLDHTAFLGNTIPEIAAEKAGIIKPGVPVVVGNAEGAVKQVFEKTASACGAPIMFAKDHITVTSLPDKGFTLFDVCEEGINIYRDIPCALNGWYQTENVATVMSVLKVLKSTWPISEASIKTGFATVVESTGLRGRWETISQDPTIICDTGHNEGGIRWVVDQLKQVPFTRLHFVIGMVNDKDHRAVLSLLPKEAVYYFTKAAIPRALPENQLASAAAAFGLKGNTYPTVHAALEAAKKACRPNELIFVGGSTFVVAEVL